MTTNNLIYKCNSMNPNKALWEKGDFTRIARSMRESGEALVESLRLTKRLKVLDLGCGDGTTALPAARLGADVLGVDIAQNLVDAGNRRAKEHGLTNCKFQEGDASNLHDLEDQAFDLVVSIFGAMFAPKPFDVAREIVRVTRHGGRNSYRSLRAGPTGPGCPPSAPRGMGWLAKEMRSSAADPYAPAEGPARAPLAGGTAARPTGPRCGPGQGACPCR